MIGGQDLLGTWGPLVCLCLFAGMMLLHELGRRLGVRRRARIWKARASDSARSRAPRSACSACSSPSRFRVPRRVSMCGEISSPRRPTSSNKHGYASISCPKPSNRKCAGTFATTWIHGWPCTTMPDLNAANRELDRSRRLQLEIWKGAVTATRNSSGSPFSCQSALGGINSMIEITTTRTMATRVHPPRHRVRMLFTAALLAALPRRLQLGRRQDARLAPRHRTGEHRVDRALRHHRHRASAPGAGAGRFS